MLDTNLIQNIKKYAKISILSYIKNKSLQSLNTNIIDTATALIDDNDHLDCTEIYDNLNCMYIENSNVYNENYYKYFKYFITNPKTDTQAIILEMDNEIIVSFRGTSSIYDVLTNIFCLNHKIDNTDMYVHKGFYDAVISVYKKIIPLIRNDKKVCVTGHSLGGALAMIFTLLYKSEFNNDDIYLYTYGAPRCGNFEFAKKMNELKNFYRITMRNDIIPKFVYKYYYYHCGEHYHINSNNDIEYIENNSIYDWYISFIWSGISLYDHLLSSNKFIQN